MSDFLRSHNCREHKHPFNQDESEKALEFTELFFSMIDRSSNRIDQFLTVSEIPLEGTGNASIVRPQAKRKMSSNPSSNIFSSFFIHRGRLLS